MGLIVIIQHIYFAGTPVENNLIWLSKGIPAWSSTDVFWCCPRDSKKENVLFGLCFKTNHYVKLCNWLLCNTFYELDSPACNLIPGIIPVGPLLLGNQLSSHVLNLSASHFYGLFGQTLSMDRFPNSWMGLKQE